MHTLLRSYARFVSSKRGSIAVLVIWLAAIVILSGIAPGAKEHAISSSEGSIHANMPSAEAKALVDKHFPSDQGLTALLVFHSDQPITADERQAISTMSEWLSSEERPATIAGALPFHMLPVESQDKLFSEDGSTLLLQAAFHKEVESGDIYDTLEDIREYGESIGLGAMQLEITGPAGIASDTIKLFTDADLVLLFSTVGLILILLIAIYRSPLLSLIPLLIAGIVYQAVDRLLGLAAQNGWITVDKQALSIMMILLFAVLTDYCLFVVSRYREELRKTASKHNAMQAAMMQVGEPILFSGGTVLLAVIVLFTAVFQPYYYFAPVFSIAMAVILLGGLTLIPAVFTLTGRAAFWPFKPKQELGSGEDGEVPGADRGALGRDSRITTNSSATRARKQPLWSRIAKLVVKRPGYTAGAITAVMLLAALNVPGISFSFNLMKSFPEDLSSRQGFELLEQNFPKGRLAPVTVILESDATIDLSEEWLLKLSALTKSLDATDGVSELTPNVEQASAGILEGQLPRDFMAADGQAVRLQLTLADNPYEHSALQVIDGLRDNSKQLLEEAGLEPDQYRLHYAGPTAQQLDVRSMNERDTILVFSIVILLITIMLIFQSRSILIALTMMATMLLSYAAAFGLSWLIVSQGFGYESISYRLPMYTFVFLIALGVDYNIMLVSRIMEEAKQRSWKEAVFHGLSATGGVISSAGVILAATFCVLMTQPLQELFLFGFMMGIGIIMDTFIIRGMLLPSLLLLLERWIKRSAHHASARHISSESYH
ncbi:MMPL family transporter [Paenibacillus sp. J5C_2022]|uniref:MMPL family transporter n=1 Tax=Paenibacillus sp. J5C2022 TaxID=2977129 RepID=UPI0021D30E32|nr:MMPL family transporter [Paenibacillus sp. J5C2022]MCU6707732.1 MMPL family transporter [Paenibacillus sp. J5C2022]